MPWQTEMTQIVRFLVDDIDSVLYTDVRIENFILANAQLVQNEVPFNTTYIVDIDSVSLSPDPTSGSKDNAFINLVSLKTASMIVRGEYKQQARESVRFRDHHTTIDNTAIAEHLKKLADDLTKAYEQAKTQYLLGERNPGKGIFSPVSHPDLNINQYGLFR